MTRSAPLLLLLGFTLQTAIAADSVVVFNELHYHPASNEASNEWVELHNQMTIDIDLSAWSITGSIGYDFPEGTLIPGGGHLVIAANPAALQAATGATNIVGPFIGRLNNANGTVRLRDRNNRVMDAFEYRDGGKWPVAPDGSGATLAKQDPSLASDAPGNWTSSVLNGGTPGRRNFPAPPTVRRQSLLSFQSLWRYDASGADLGTSWREPAYNDSAWAGRNNATLLSYWPFNGDATALRGVSGSLVGAVTAANDRNGAAGGALSFNGAAQQYVNVAGGGGLNGATAGTISLWVKWTGTQDADCCGSFGAVLARQANGQFSDNILALNNASPALGRIVWKQSGGPAPILLTSTAAVGESWHHVAITFAASGSTLYVDGVAQATAIGPTLRNNPATPLSIGAWASDGGGFCTATLDDVAVWDQPLTASQVSQLASQTRSPLDFAAPDSAVYYAGDGRMVTNDDLRRTPLGLGPTTYYFRSQFVVSDEPTNSSLALDLCVDDGAVIYLNGAEVHRHNMPGGTVNYLTLATSAIGDAPITPGIALATTNLIRGTNLLAVEVHQAAPGDAGMVFGAGLTLTVTPPTVLETRRLIGRNDVWKYEDSNSDLGAGWRAPTYDDVAWPSGAALLYAGSPVVDGVPLERLLGVSVTASSEYTPDSRLAVNLVNGAGMIGNAHVLTPGGTMWLSRGTFQAPNDLNPQLTFDLGSPVPLRTMKVWNYNEDLPNRPELLSRGVASADILVGLTNTALTNQILGQLFNKAPGTVTDFSQPIDLGGVQTRYVRLDRLTNFPGGDNRFVGLSEVQFFRDPDLHRTPVQLGAATHYFRKTFHFAGDPTAATLLLNAAVDDGAVFYLNGVEIRRQNLPAGTVTHATPASSDIGNATFTGPLTVASSALVTGPNVLAVEVHQPSGGDLDMIFGVELTALVAPPSPESFEPGGLVFNEITAPGNGPFQIELVNRGAPLEAGGYVVQRTGISPAAEYVLPLQALATGSFLVLDQAVLGFAAVPGDKLFLLTPSRRVIADAIEVHQRARARSPDGTGEWLTPQAVTPGASNAVTLHSEVVLNEIMYDAPPTLEEPAVIATNAVISLTNVWRYDQSGMDLGTAWRTTNYDDSAWPTGPGLLYVTDAALVAPKNTLLTLGPTTYYFRSSFVYTGAPAILSLSLRHLVDDGVVLYLNGREVDRFNVPAGELSYTNTASAQVVNASLRPAVTVALSNLVLGVNVLAAEVHQSALTGNDVVFGAELTAVVEASRRIPYERSPEQWVELHNRSAAAVNLDGWRLDEGIDFRFGPGTLIPAGGYLVVAKDPPALLAKFPGIPIVGPYTNSLSRGGERIVLRDAADNPADAVHYYDDGRWPEGAGGGGSSLELRDARADNEAGEAWSASNERGRSVWRTYSYRGIAAASAVGPDTQWREVGSPGTELEFAL